MRGTPESPEETVSVPSTVRFRRALTAVVLSTALLAGATACGGGGTQREELSAASMGELAALAAAEPAAAEADELAAATPSPSTSAEKQKFAKTRFVANAGLAAGATYQWIVKPYRAGKFKKGAKGRTFALIKAGLAGAFAYNRLKAAADNAKGDPLLSKAMAPLTAGIESLKGLGTKLRKGQAGDADISSFDDVISSVKEAGKSAGATVTDKVPSASQLGG
ncbi:hypothetical protein ADK53_26110 [Streptomyces sp. WM6373]|nr:hypothetical protein ADK53_26110 [Streptomyces sp. WM6373]KOU58202.1 hypothetical protein ADK96_35035 [Streptomyces sp. IGB124]KOU71940.1 hypothetical protein ADK61_28575 [Streptomyces sp. XY66]KOU80953.1 hypothetical protein ADK93_32170 [Streptomyces sp. XY58]KOV01808.1 hypothetical protein ADK89_30890 [Streptomyces sp. XY37]KOV14673.1 hypothetical protein ADK90_33885 [Streptomyces sp. XY413]KOV28876.1 hypothetical protein ADK97_33475 [Streptomyces sp. H021]KOV41861.1 hypothetical protei